MNEDNELIKRLSFENIIWITFIIVSVYRHSIKAVKRFKRKRLAQLEAQRSGFKLERSRSEMSAR